MTQRDQDSLSQASDDELLAEFRRRGIVATTWTLDDVRHVIDAEPTCASLDEDAANDLALEFLRRAGAGMRAHLRLHGNAYVERAWSRVREEILVHAAKLDYMTSLSIRPR